MNFNAGRYFFVWVHIPDLFLFNFFVRPKFLDSVSDCATSYYSENDPFDYLYSCGTQYSDPVYEAVNKVDRTPLSPGKS